ncbi:PsiF family protein [Pseudomonas sp. RIT623]|uniref:PsiF family protein n=1 Tax=Pseudomonas sp. RIT623 TaxID=2559075 RepID=UPI0010705775|nr:PsiF family protein [Pseudomonas sp. RIT623]TFF41823.1 phosphate starvation-inducible protein PsiF [Pseudomonas sp. RIT623]
MKLLHVPLLVLGMLIAGQGFAATAQQEKMTTCNADATAKALKGDARKAYMSTCLKKGEPAKAMTPQERMKACNADPKAKALKGDERKAFMSDCLKKK